MHNDEVIGSRVALYCRVSTEEQREGQTIDSQVAELERFAKSKQWAIVRTYKDEGWSGSLLARPALDELRDHAQQKQFDIVLVNDVDRLARDVSHLGIVKRDLEGKGVRLVFRKLPGEQSPTQNLLVNILGSFAEFERELIADRTRRGKRHKVEVRKQYMGGIPAYGYKYVPKGHSGDSFGHLEVQPEEAAVVKQIYSWVEKEGLSADRVVARLNNLGVRPRKGGKQWQKSSVLRILHTEAYAGVWYYNKHVHCEPMRTRTVGYRKSLRTSNRRRARSEWIPVALADELRIVERVVWDRVQDQIRQNTSFSLRNTKHFYLLRGLVYCGGCGRRYVGDPGHGTFGYRCMVRCKRSPGIGEQSLNDAVWKAVKTCLKEPDVVTAGLKSVVRHQDNEVRSVTEQNEFALEQIRAEESRILQAYRLGVITAGQLDVELKGLRARKTMIESARDNRPAPVGSEMIQRSLHELRTQISLSLDTLNIEKKREILEQLVTKIVFDGRQIRIGCRVPLTSGTTGHAAQHGLPEDPSSPFCSTAATTSGYRVPNIPSPQERKRTIEFEIEQKVEKDLTAKKEASRRNLVKANAALAAMRQRSNPAKYQQA